MKKTLAAVLAALVLTASPVYSAEVSFDFYSRFHHSSHHYGRSHHYHSHGSSRCITDDQSQECSDSRYDRVITVIIVIGLLAYIILPIIRKK